MDDDDVHGIASGLHRHDVRQVTPLDLESIRRAVGRRRKARAAASIGGGLLVAAAMAWVLAVAVPSVPGSEGHPAVGDPGHPTVVDTTRVRPSPMVSVRAQDEDFVRDMQTLSVGRKAVDVDYDVLDVTSSDDPSLVTHVASDDDDVRVIRNMFEARGTAKPLATGNTAIMFTVLTNVCEPGLLVRGVERRGDVVVVLLRKPVEGRGCVDGSRDGHLLTVAVPTRQIEGREGVLVAIDGQ